MFDKHMFIFGGPRNGTWHFQYLLTKQHPIYYSGTENIDHWDTGYSSLTGITDLCFKSVSDDIIYKGLSSDLSRDGGMHFFEGNCLLDTKDFYRNIQRIESFDRLVVNKGQEVCLDAIDNIKHHKVFIQRNRKDQIRSWVIAMCLKRFHWIPTDMWDEMTLPLVTLGGIDGDSVVTAVKTKFDAVDKMYNKYKDQDNFTLIRYEDVTNFFDVEQDTIAPTPNLTLSEKVERLIERAQK